MTTISLLDSLSFVTDNVPDWITRLDDLTEQITRRHSELTQLSVRQLKPKNGSTESLRPRTNGEGEAIPLTSEPTSGLVAGMRQQPGHQQQQQQQQQQQLRRKRKTETISSSVEPTKYRTRSMIIVYYDSAVQEAFEGIVRVVGTARNNIRKGRMAAKMKQMTALPDGVSSLMGGDDSTFTTRLAFSRISRSRGAGEEKTVLDTIDQTLEVSQSLCEHGAHQFLRDGDCSAEISSIRLKLEEVARLAKIEADKLAETETRSGHEDRPTTRGTQEEDEGPQKVPPKKELEEKGLGQLGSEKEALGQTKGQASDANTEMPGTGTAIMEVDPDY